MNTYKFRDFVVAAIQFNNENLDEIKSQLPSIATIEKYPDGVFLNSEDSSNKIYPGEWVVVHYFQDMVPIYVCIMSNYMFTHLYLEDMDKIRYLKNENTETGIKLTIE